MPRRSIWRSALVRHRSVTVDGCPIRIDAARFHIRCLFDLTDQIGRIYALRAKLRLSLI
jgi:hypothetical protein